MWSYSRQPRRRSGSACLVRRSCAGSPMAICTRRSSGRIIGSRLPSLSGRAMNSCAGWPRPARTTSRPNSSLTDELPRRRRGASRPSTVDNGKRPAVMFRREGSPRGSGRGSHGSTRPGAGTFGFTTVSQSLDYTACDQPVVILRVLTHQMLSALPADRIGDTPHRFCQVHQSSVNSQLLHNCGPATHANRRRRRGSCNCCIPLSSKQRYFPNIR